MPKRYLEYKRKNENPTSKKSGFVLAWIFIGILFLIGGSYAYLQMNLDGSKKVSVVAGVFQIKYEDQETIKLENAYPMSDEEGESLSSYQFSVENVGDINANYEIILEENRGNTLDKKYIRYILKKRRK